MHHVCVSQNRILLQQLKMAEDAIVQLDDKIERIRKVSEFDN